MALTPGKSCSSPVLRFLVFFLEVLSLGCLFSDDAVVVQAFSTIGQGQSKVKVILPLSLNINASYEHREAMFGSPPFGGSITGPLYYADSVFCSKPDINNNLSPRNRVKYYPTDPRDHLAGEPFLLMVNRGDCTFVQKVRNAQHMGAAGVLIADNLCVCGDRNCPFDGIEDPCEDREPTMADDGSGSDVRIPSVLMYKRDTDKFKEFFLDASRQTMNQTMRVELSFPPPPGSPTSTATASSTSLVPNPREPLGPPIPQPPVKIMIDYWMSPSDRRALSFLFRFRPIFERMADTCVDFVPHMYLIDGAKAGCLGTQNSFSNNNNREKDTEKEENDMEAGENEEEDEQLPCENLCTNRGRYCAPDPDSDLHIGVSGADVVKESLRQLCIWSLDDSYEDSDDLIFDFDEEVRSAAPRGLFWWKYLDAFYNKCTPENLFNDEKCIDRVYKNVGINKDSVERCMMNAGGLTKRDYNSMLGKDLSEQYTSNIYVVPTLHINKVQFDVSVTTNELFRTICSLCGYQAMPDLCRSCAYCHDASACVAAGGRCPSLVVNGSVISSSSTTTSAATPVSSSSTSSSSGVITVAAVEAEKSDGVSLFTFLSSVVMVSTLAIMVAFWHYKRTRDEARAHVRAIMADYMPLNEDGTPSVPNGSGLSLSSSFEYPQNGVSQPQGDGSHDLSLSPRSRGDDGGHERLLHP